MNRKIFIVLLIIIFSFDLIGCSERAEINEKSIVIGMGIDKHKDTYLVTLQVLDAGEIAGKAKGTASPVTNFSGEGKSVFEALRRLTLKLPRRAYLAHVRALILGEDLAREGIRDVLDYFARYHELRSTFYVLVAKETTASDVLKILTSIEKIPANKIHSTLELAAKFWSPALTVRKYQLLSAMASSGREAILSSMLVRGEVDTGEKRSNIESTIRAGYLELGPIAVFKGDKLVGWLDESESAMTNAILGKVRNTVRRIPYKNGEWVTLEVYNLRTNMNVINYGGKPKIIVNLRVTANIGEVSDAIKINDIKTINEIEKSGERFIGQKLESTVRRVQQQINSDIFGFGQAIERQKPQVWDKVKDNWYKGEFSRLPVEVNFKLTINDTGVIIDPIEME